MAEIGHDVLGVDIDKDKIALLNSGRAWFHEPRLDEILARNVAAGRLRFATSMAEAAGFGRFYLGVARLKGLPTWSVIQNLIIRGSHACIGTSE